MEWLIIEVVIDSSNRTTNYHRTQPNIDATREKKTTQNVPNALPLEMAIRRKLVLWVKYVREKNQTKRNETKQSNRYIRYTIECRKQNYTQSQRAKDRHRLKRRHRHRHWINRENELSCETGKMKYAQTPAPAHTSSKRWWKWNHFVFFPSVNMIENSA